MTPRLGLHGLLLTLPLLGCGEVGQAEVAVPLHLRGEAPGEVRALSGQTVTLTTADLAFGPLYLCPGVSAGELCATARLEWLDSAVVDLLSRRSEEVGMLQGTTGSVRSLMYDLGLSSQLTQREPLVLTAAADLGGYSLRLAGTVESDQGDIPFSVNVLATQGEGTEVGVPLVRRTLGFRGEHEVTESEAGLRITLPASHLLGGVDFDAYLQEQACREEGPAVVCDAAEAVTCDGDRETDRMRCSGEAPYCVHGLGCVAALTLEEDGAAYRAIRTALLSGATPTLDWNYEAN